MAGLTNSKILGTIPLLITVCLLGIPAHAKYGGGSGTAEDPYQIATAEDLVALGETPEDYGKHFILVHDIDLGPNLPNGKVFEKAVIAPDIDPMRNTRRSKGRLSAVFLTAMGTRCRM